MSGKHWTKEQTQMVIDNYDKVNWLVTKLSKTPASVRQKIFRLGLAQSAYKDWTPEEEELLKKVYTNNKIDYDEVKRMFQRSVGAIQTHARRLGLGRKKWSQEHEALLANSYDGTLKSINAIAEVTGRTPCAVIGKANKLGIVKPINYWTAEEDSILRNNYLALPREELEGLLPSRTWASIIHRAGYLKLGHRLVDCRTYTFNYKYFNKIDTEEKAYWLGFIYADGSVDLMRKRLRISLVTEGKQHLEKLAKTLEYSGDVSGPYQMKWKYQGRDRVSEYYSLNLMEDNFVDDLVSLGVVPNKTFLVKFPDIPVDLQRHFIRGVFDGDGCITQKTTKYKDKVYVTASMSFVGAVSDFLERIVEIFFENVGRKVSVIHKKSSLTYQFGYQGASALRIRDWMYDGATVWMQCKKDKFYSYEYPSLRPKDKEHQEQTIDAEMVKRGWKRLSEYNGYYGDMTYQCDKGHIWTSQCQNFKQGKGCPYCRDMKTSERMKRING